MSLEIPASNILAYFWLTASGMRSRKAPFALTPFLSWMMTIRWWVSRMETASQQSA